MEPFEYYDDTLCIRARWLIDQITGRAVYGNLTARKQLRTLRRGGNGRTALIEYAGIPERFKSAITEKLGYDPEKKTADRESNPADAQLLKHIVPDLDAEKFYLSYRKPDGGRLNAEQIAAYSAGAAVLRAAGATAAERTALRRASGNTTRGKTSVWTTVAAAVGRLDRNLHPHTLPGCERRLRELWRRFLDRGYDALVHGMHGNRNAAKVNDSRRQSLLTELLASPRNPDNEQIARLYNSAAERIGWPTISAAAVAVWREKLKLTTYAGRRGARAFSDKATMQAKRRPPSRPLYFWSVDGWDVELLYRRPDERNGRLTYHHRPTVAVALDPCLDYPVGYAVGTHETPELIRAALRNAVNHVAQLFGRRYKCLQIQSDRYAVKKLSPLYNAVAEKFTPAAVGNAKSKPVERKFLTYNKYCQILFENWSGFGLTAKKDKQPNVEWLNARRREFPDYENCKMQIARVIEAVRREKRDRYVSLWNDTPDEDKHPLDDETYLLHFGEHNVDRQGRPSKNTLQPDGLTLTVAGQRYLFDCFDPDFRRHSSLRWTLLYDPADLSRALAVNDDRSLRFTLERKYVQPMALRERNENDRAELERLDDFNRNLKRIVTEERATSYRKVVELFEEHREKLNDTLVKLLIVDDKGQHKDRRNDVERTIAAAAAADLDADADRIEGEILRDDIRNMY